MRKATINSHSPQSRNNHAIWPNNRAINIHVYRIS